MSAKIVTNNNKNRVNLGEVLPLASPFSVHIYPAYMCNFKCSYCLHSLSDEKLKEMFFKKELMDYETYIKAIDDIKKFPDKLKALIFAGHGEPLVHKRIADMVAYAKKQDITHKTEIVTNGYLLTPKLSDKLIDAELDSLRISIQGLSQQKYKNVVGTDIDFQNFLYNLKYFYKHKKDTKVYIKIVDVALDSNDEEQKFYDIFGQMCDEIAIEYIIPFATGVDYSKIKDDFGKCKQGHEMSSSNICAMPFYMMAIEPNGSVVPCCSTLVPVKLGNIKKDSILDIWNGRKLKEFRIMHLKNNRHEHNVCGSCTVPTYGMQQGDYLDSYAVKLLESYQKS